jgi:hypothetical protein
LRRSAEANIAYLVLPNPHLELSEFFSAAMKEFTLLSLESNMIRIPFSFCITPISFSIQSIFGMTSVEFLAFQQKSRSFHGIFYVLLLL